MAMIRKELRSPRSADAVWAALKRFEAAHELARGFVTATRMEGHGVRVVTFANGAEAREWLVSRDDAERRLCYAITSSPRHTHYNAVAQVFEDGEGSRFIWTVDFLPDEMAGQQNAAMELGIGAMAKTLA